MRSQPVRLHVIVLAAVLSTCAASVSFGSASAQATQQPERQRGSLLLELGLSTAGAAIGLGASYLVLTHRFTCGDDHSDTLGGCGLGTLTLQVMVPTLLIPGLAIAGSMLGGSMTEGEGRFGLTLLGGFAGGGLGLLVASVGTRIADGPNADLDPTLAVGLAAVGAIAGSVLGYRLGARKRPQIPSVVFDGSHAMLLWRGTL